MGGQHSGSNDGDKGGSILDKGAQLAGDAQHAITAFLGHPEVKRVDSFVIISGLSSATYTASMAAFHLAGGCLRISCGTPLLGSAMGLMAVAASSALAGHMGRHTWDALQEHSSDIGQAFRSLPRRLLCARGEDLLADALLGSVLFKMCSFEFRRVMPSHLARPGAFGYVTVPTSAGNEYATAVEKGQLQSIYRHFGCHHCGSWWNGVIGDHIPPYKAVKGLKQQLASEGSIEKILTKVASSIGLKDTTLKQVYYAQCNACSNFQSQLMRNGSRRTRVPGLWPAELVVHHPWRLATRNAMPGILVALKYGCMPEPPKPEPPAQDGRRKREQRNRSGGRKAPAASLTLFQQAQPLQVAWLGPTQA